MDPLPPLLQPLADPNVAFLLFVAGALLIASELVQPTLVAGILGAIALVLSFVGFGYLPVNMLGLLLLVVGVGLLVLETQIVSHGVLTILGVLALIAGASILYQQNPAPPVPVQVAPPIIVLVAGAAGLIMAFVTVGALRSRRMRASPGTVGTSIAVGTEGVVQAPLAPLGTVYLGGETWSARTPDERLVPRDTPVRLVAFDRLVAVVEPEATLPDAAPTATLSLPPPPPTATRS